jgi:PAS domain S-box-containing protein
VPDGVLTIDARGAIQSINPAVETLFSRPSHRLIGHDLSELIENTPDLLSRLKLDIHSPASQARCWELDARRANGTTFPIELSAGRFDLLSAEHYTLVVRDIAFRREAEARDRQHQAELAHVSRVAPSPTSSHSLENGPAARSFAADTMTASWLGSKRTYRIQILCSGAAKLW